MLKLKFVDKLPPMLRNKYALVLLVFVVWMTFFDESSFINRIANRHRVGELEDQKEHYLEKIENDQKRLEELRGNDKEIEKFAREQYHMKKDNEDIFIIHEE